MNKVLLHMEGLAVLALSLWFYGHHQLSWLLYIILSFAPEISMIAYLFNNKLGAILYNIFHTYIISIIVIFFGLVFVNSPFLAIGLIWSAHIGMDRMLGYGLKYPTQFKDTHLQRI